MTQPDEIPGHIPSPNPGCARARPFVKWAGGKRSLMTEIARLLPENFGTYWEPFVGGGAVFFAMDGRITTARLSDVNAELALAYQVVRNRPEDLIEQLSVHAENHPNGKDYYYKVRKMTHSPDSVEVTARFIYLNRTCYNGLYRVNRNDQFNVPMGRYKNRLICDKDGIRRASRALQKAAIKFQDFDKIEPGKRDFIYCDPPYDKTFDRFSPGRFGEEEQRRLRDSVVKWHKLGALVMVSNADTPLVRSLYTGDPFRLHGVTALRYINCRVDELRPMEDLIITTYDSA